MGGRGGASHGGGGGGIPFESFPADAFSAFRKLNAFNFSRRIDADQLIRPWLDQAWNTLKDMEKYAVWQYTAGSGGFNRPLSGYVRRWDNFAGEGKVPWNSENKPMGLTGEFIQITGGAGIDYERGIAACQPGTVLAWIATAENGWHAVKIGGKVGWVAGEYSRVK